MSPSDGSVEQARPVTKRVVEPFIDKIPDEFRTKIIEKGKKGVGRIMEAANLKKQPSKPPSLRSRFTTKVKQHPRALIALAAVAVIFRRMRNGD